VTEVDIKIDIIVDLYDIEWGADCRYLNVFIGFNARINYDLVSYPSMARVEGEDVPSYSIRASDQIGIMRFSSNFSYTTPDGTIH